MTTREIYFKNLVLCDLPACILGYTYTDENNVIQIGKSICIELSTDEIIVEKYVKNMQEIENKPGFMFWNNSTKGEEFFKNNWGTISKSFVFTK